MLTEPRSVLLLVALTVGLASCQAMPPHQIKLASRDGGSTGNGTAQRSMTSSGSMTINLKGKTYKGDWTYVSGGSTSFIQSWGGNSTAYGVGFSQSGSGVGNALLTSKDGSSLRCQFRYSTWTGTGIGVCKGSGDTVYDMQIETP
jgi:hypothetical protein